MPDYIPTSDADFDNWLGLFAAYVTANAAALGLTPNDIAPLTAATTGWDAAFPANETAQAAASAAAISKDHSRATAETVARPLVQQLQASPLVTDAQRSAMKITVRATTRTRASVPATAPMATVDTSRRLQHIIDFRDSASPKSKAKPAGVAGCEIWGKVGRAPRPRTSASWRMWPRTAARRIWRNTPARRRGRWLVTGCAGSTRAAKKARGASRSARRYRDENQLQKTRD
jgi:hypothetical protein